METRTKITLIIFIFIQMTVFGQKIMWDNYIKKYNSYAVSEMKRTGIPASIKMAQAILESNAGRSILAKNANNHFGIKCGGSWSGETYYREDDDYGSDGKMIESCFRKYDSAIESFIAHSEFLLNNSGRYGFLFDLDPTDYKGWAKGLKKAGYATNPAYADLLISVIEKHNLADFDTISIDELMADATPKEKPKAASLKMIRVNGIKAVRSRHGDSPYSIAAAFKVDIKRLLKYNDELFTASQNLDDKIVIYLQPKRNKYRGRQKYHVVRHGETIRSIAQSYGIKYEKLRKRNHIPLNVEVKNGEKIALRGRVKSKNTPIFLGDEQLDKEYEDYDEPKATNRKEALTFFNKVSNYFAKDELDKSLEVDDEYLWGGENPKEEKPIESYVIANKKQNESIEDSFTGSLNNTEEEIVVEPSKVFMSGSNYTVAASKLTYTVAKGDTLYGISQKYGISLSSIKVLNNLNNNTIYPGQKLKLK